MNHGAAQVFSELSSNFKNDGGYNSWLEVVESTDKPNDWQLDSLNSCLSLLFIPNRIYSQHVSVRNPLFH